MPLALYTFGMFARPSADPVNDGFHALNDRVLLSVDQAEGMIARSGYASDPGPASWGPEVYPRFYEERGDGWSPATLSLWTDLEAMFAFTYSGLHAAALSRGREWFEKPAWPPLAIWWHRNAGYPTWADAVRRHEHLHDFGPTATAFTFKAPFHEQGAPVRLDKARIQALRSARAES
ncbi:DUF3291 domain-containing protein [Pararhodobacter sp.]|uniref:DUF3291 domain-containing protein n=1 Tax=Pararhodobacter sp. TaxID=2127056 RepID=UPI002FDD9D96